MHLPDAQTLANIAGAYYGRTDIIIPGNTLAKTGPFKVGSKVYNNMCIDYYGGTSEKVKCYDGDYIPAASADLKAGVSVKGAFFTNYEISSATAYKCSINSDYNSWSKDWRSINNSILCTGD